MQWHPSEERRERSHFQRIDCILLHSCLGNYLINMREVERGDEVIVQGASDRGSPSEPLWVSAKAIEEIGTAVKACLYLQQMALLTSKDAPLESFFPSLSLAVSSVRSCQALNPRGPSKGLPFPRV